MIIKNYKIQTFTTKAFCDNPACSEQQLYLLSIVNLSYPPIYNYFCPLCNKKYVSKKHIGFIEHINAGMTDMKIEDHLLIENNYREPPK